MTTNQIRNSSSSNHYVSFASNLFRIPSKCMYNTDSSVVSLQKTRMQNISVPLHNSRTQKVQSNCGPARARKWVIQQYYLFQSPRLSSPRFQHRIWSTTQCNLWECRARKVAPCPSRQDSPYWVDESHRHLFLGARSSEFFPHPNAVPRHQIVSLHDP